MSKEAGAGELRTPITVYKRKTATQSHGYSASDEWEAGPKTYCKWVNAHGTEALEASRLRLGELATLTLRYLPGVTTRCKIMREADADLYDVISVDDVENRHAWLEIKVQRGVPA